MDVTVSRLYRKKDFYALGGVSSVGTYTNVFTISAHNSLKGIQGGITGEYYHLTSAEHIELTHWLDNVTLDSAGDVTFGGNIYLPDDGTIGQAAGPLLTFDDSNNYLEITGCNVGIGTTTPGYKLEVSSEDTTSIAWKCNSIASKKFGFGSDISYLYLLNITDLDTLMTWSNGGNVGIGTVTPSHKLEVSGSFVTSGADFELGDGGTADVDAVRFFSVGGNLYLQNGDGNNILFRNKVGGEYARFTNSGLFGIGTMAPNAKIESLAETEQLRLSYDATHYTSFTVVAAGGLTIAPLAGQGLTISLATTGDFIVNTNQLIIDTSEAKIGIGAAPVTYKLEVTGDIEAIGGSYYTSGENTGLIHSVYGTSLVSIGANWMRVSPNLYIIADLKVGVDAYGDDFVTGFQGTSWKIADEGDAEFESMFIRGSLTVTELILNRLRYQDGGLIIGAGGGKIQAISGVGGVGYEKVWFEDPEGNGIIPFTEGAIVLVQDFDLDRTTVVKKMVRQVAAIDDSDLGVHLEPTAGWDPASEESAWGFEIGDEMVAIGHISDTNLDSTIYMSAVDSGNPFLRMQDGVDSYAKWGLGTKTALKLQIGNLEGLAGYDIIPALEPTGGWFGLYSNNAYLTGRVVLPTAGMTNEGSTASDVRIYAGDSYANRATAPFRVTQDGSLTAVGVATLGTNVGLDPESTDTNNVTMVGCQLYEGSRNDDTGSLYFNCVGYQGGTTKYRSTYIGNGKGDYLLQAVGCSSMISMMKAFSFVQNDIINDTILTTIDRVIYIMTPTENENLSLTLPLPSEIDNQFGAGKSATNPMIIVINTNDTYNFTVWAGNDSFEGSDIYYSGSTSKFLTLYPRQIVMMTYVDGDWYAIESL